MRNLLIERNSFHIINIIYIFQWWIFFYYSIKLKYYDDGSSAITGLKRVSKPGLKIYVKKDEIPSYFSGMGVAIVSTSKGIMTGLEAKKLSLGGEVLFYIW